MRKRLAVAMDGITPQERREAIDALLAEWLGFEKEDLSELLTPLIAA
jgi:hypothetical protein